MIRLILTSGRGPAECRIALTHVLKRMAQEADDQGLCLDVARGRDPDGHGPVSAIVMANGDGAEAFAKRWAGTLLWVCQSKVRPTHRRKNWFIGCSLLAAPQGTVDEIDPKDVQFDTLRAGGPGGQHQNTTESAVRASHRPTGLSVVVRDQRSQHRNKVTALERLRALLDASKALNAAADKQRIQSAHDDLERGRPVRTFRGENFREA